MFYSLLTHWSTCALTSYCLKMEQNSINNYWTMFPTTWHWLHFFCPISPINGKLDFFHKYLKSTLKKLCENYPDKWDRYINQNIIQLPCETTLCNCWNTLLPSLWQGSQFTLPPIARTHAVIPSWPESWYLGHIECNWHYLHIENQATGKTRPYNVNDVYKLPGELWNVDTKFGIAETFINHQANLPTFL